MSRIEWTDATWNPTAGCSVLSPGCINCYAMPLAARLERMGQQKYAMLTRETGGRAKWTGNLTIDRTSLDRPKQWKKGRRIFVNSMSDLFHNRVPLSYIRDVFEVMATTRQHTYQILTKRAERLFELSSLLIWPENVWMGVSVESDEYLWRIDRLRETGARVKFLSIEPLLGPLVPELSLAGIDWVIVGGESGPGARDMSVDWVRPIRDQCVRERIPFFFKQWGGVRKHKTGRELDGRTWDEFP